MVFALMRRASFLEFVISSTTEMGRTFPAVLRELNSPSMVKPSCEKKKINVKH